MVFSQRINRAVTVYKGHEMRLFYKICRCHLLLPYASLNVQSSASETSFLSHTFLRQEASPFNLVDRSQFRLNFRWVFLIILNVIFSLSDVKPIRWSNLPLTNAFDSFIVLMCFVFTFLQLPSCTCFCLYVLLLLLWFNLIFSWSLGFVCMVFRSASVDVSV